MQRRIIYIKNPSQGSHFRVIGDEGGTTQGHHGSRAMKPHARPTAPGKPPRNAMHPYGIPGVFIGTGGAHYKKLDTDWSLDARPIINISTAYALPEWSPGFGPYEQEWTPGFQPASTLLGQLYDIARHIDPATGGQIAPYGTPGTLKIDASMPSLSMGEDWSQSGNPNRSSPWSFGPIGAPLPSAYTYLSPHRNDPRPWWAQ